MQTLNFSRPVLPPLRYALFLPWRGIYVRAVDAAAGCFKTTTDPRHACELPDSSAREIGMRVVRALCEPVELRQLTR